MSTRSTMFRRLSLSCFGAAAAGGLGAALEAAWATRAAEAGGETIGFGSAFIASFGLLAPIFAAVGAAVGVASLVVWPDQAPSLRQALGRLRAHARGRSAETAALAPLAMLGTLLWLTLSAQAARHILTLTLAPWPSGVAIAGASATLGIVIGLFALSFVPVLRQLLARAASSSGALVDPVVTGSLGLAIAVGLFAYGTLSGTTSGDGGMLQIFGVLRRPELDLRGAAVAATIALAAFSAPGLLPSGFGRYAVVLALLPLGLTAYAGSALNQEVGVAQAVERGAPLGKIAVRALRRMSDGDGDGVSGRFGGGDCNDADPAISPLATEIIDNGVDEDCSGSDLTQAALERLAPRAEEPPEPKGDVIADDLNVVLITIDTLRYDLGYAGYDKPVSPNLDALAARSTTFDVAYALASYTGKSIGPTLIGKYGSETNRNWGHFNKFDESDEFLAERIQAAGIHTVAVHAHRYFDEWGGLERGFDVLDMSAAPPPDADWAKDDRRSAHLVTDAAVKRIQDAVAGDKRFFVWAHYLDPHAAYLAHDDAPDFGRDTRARYDGEVWYTDKHVGRLIDAIADSPAGDRTVIIVTSDHGEAFGEHDMYKHGFELWEVLVRVPFIVYVPGAEPRRVPVRRSLIDLVPTVLDLMKLDRPSGEGTDFISGISLVADIFPEPGSEHAERDIFIDMPAGPYNDARRALIHDGLKVTVSNEARYDLFDLNDDPGELKNLRTTDAERLKAMKERYAAFKAQLRWVEVTGKRKF